MSAVIIYFSADLSLPTSSIFAVSTYVKLLGISFSGINYGALVTKNNSVSYIEHIISKTRTLTKIHSHCSKAYSGVLHSLSTPAPRARAEHEEGRARVTQYPTTPVFV